MKKMNKNLLHETLNDMMYRANYVVNETPTYKPIIDKDYSNDDVPPQILSDTQNLKEDDEDSLVQTTGSTAPNIEASPINVNTGLPDTELTVPQPEEKTVDELQNDIIKRNINIMGQFMERMKSIEDYVHNVENNVSDLNNSVQTLTKDVDEVREPSTYEKLMSHKENSYPYYLNLNDNWKGNWFDANRKEDEKNNVIRKLEDGTYEADFNDLDVNLPNINDTFNTTYY